MDETKRKISNEFSKTIKSSSTHITHILPNSSFHKQISEETAHYSQLVAASNATTVPKLSVQYIAISLNNEQLVNSFCKQMENCNQTASNITKIESFESEKKCLISLPLENAMNECDSNSLKINQSITNQRLLISPTDFLTLSEEGMRHKNSAVKKDVNLCSGNIEIIRPNTNCENNFAICLDRYCESPLMLENQKESQLICDDETSCNGRNSRLSETAEDITTDELFANTFGTDQTSSLREVVTPIENDNSSNAPILVNKDILITNKSKHIDENILCEEQKELSEANETKPVLTILDRLDADTDSTNCSNSITTSDNSFTFISTQTSTNVSTQTTTTTVLSPLDIKLLQTGIKDSILLANLAAALPSSMTSRQIALQVIREDGTSLVLPLNTKHESNDMLTIKDANSDLPVSTSLLLAEVVNQNESIRPFKCELCNSTFTRLGNYTRHKKIHSYPSKEDQRFRCEICSKSFIQRCDLARHLHIHRGTEPHRCPQCGKGYIRHSDLVTHQRFHNKEKPFSCPHCSKGFCQRGDLNRHLRSIHLQLKPILCSHCHKKFAKEETLLRHINATHRAENSTLN